VFQSDRSGHVDLNRDIFVIDAGGTGECRLTGDPAADFGPDWAPDGGRITFTSDRGGAPAVYAMNPDGRDVRQLAPDRLNGGIARHSPDGKHLIFADGFCATCGESDLWVMDTGGTGLRQVTDTAQNEIPEAWSPDSTQVLVDYSRISAEILGKGDIAVVTLASGTTVNLTGSNGVDESHADWQP
jgi:TolB protein